MKDKSKIKNDVVMVKVDMPFVWSDDVMPICLPQGNFSADEYQKVFISGFNFHFHRKVAQADKCHTVAGPRKAMCKHYLTKNEPSIFKGCNFATTIRAQECLMLQRFMNWSTMLPNDLKSLIIKKNISQIDPKERERRFPNQTNDIVSIPCFDENPGPYGWCGTCLSEARKGEPGYCGDDKAQEGESLYQAELSRPSEFGGWGFCDKVCQTAQKARGNELPVLLETMRLVESSEDCQKHMQLKIDADFMHLCVVAQQLAHKQIVYRMIRKIQ
ncbi:uncharacterized protein LOC111704871 [Eurytemora carolleeae]|uniref:uncharacterized protein LOC111704871 n=1 Tax=Eurytemora carolleeae TaxID=1294199 RepID=UPI000C7734E6|nr:uncharacterized protein LOC111704871 [Eurytemora carolleeae]|eukprot:XP_023333009.1 uncharacterized protein LOC111704871 [Eurytemora affinis]